VTVLHAIRNAAALDDVIASMAGDLAAAYDLLPRPAGRRVRAGAGAWLVEEPERTVRVGADRIEVDNRARRYHVDVEISRATLDSPLDPALWKE
jgi:hypothetical protein